MVANERGLSPLRVFVVLSSIQIIFFLYHVDLSNPGYVNPSAVIPWAGKVSGKMGECMEVAAWWLVYGRSPRFVVRSVLIPSMVDHTMLSAVAKSSDDTIAADMVGSHGLLPVNSLLPDVHVIVHSESELNQPKSGFPPETEAVAERTVIVVADIVGSHVLLPMNSLLSDEHVMVYIPSLS